MRSNFSRMILSLLIHVPRFRIRNGEFFKRKMFVSINSRLAELDSNRYHRPLRPSRKGSSVLLRLDVVDSPLWFLRELPQGWRTLAASKKNRTRQRTPDYVCENGEETSSSINSKSLRSKSHISLSLQFLYFQFGRKKLIIAEINILLFNRRQIRRNLLSFCFLIDEEVRKIFSHFTKD